MAFDWTRSGRTEWMTFESIPVTTKDIVNPKSKKTLGGITSMSLSFNYDSAEKVSGSLELENVNPDSLQNRLVRIYLNASYALPGGKTESTRVILATMYAGKAKGHWEAGQWSGSLELKSTLSRYTEDQLTSPRTISKGTKAKTFFSSILKDYGGWGLWSAASNFSMSTKVIDFGKTVMDYLQEVSGSSYNQVTVDEYGRTVIIKYVRPSKKPVSYTIPSGENSVMFPGVDSETNVTELPNRVALRHEWTDKKKKKSISATASVASSKSWSRNNTGRYITKAITISNLDSKNRNKTYMDKKAKAELTANTGALRRFLWKSLYMPYKIGLVVKGSMSPTSGYKMLVEQIDMRYNVGTPLEMTTTARKV